MWINRHLIFSPIIKPGREIEGNYLLYNRYASPISVEAIKPMSNT